VSSRISAGRVFDRAPNVYLIEQAASFFIRNVSADDLNCLALDVFECFRLSLREVRMPYRASVLHNGSDDRMVIICI